MNNARAIFEIKWGRLWRLMAPGAARALRVGLRVVAICAVAVAGLAAVVPHVPTWFWPIAVGALSLLACVWISWFALVMRDGAFGLDRDPYPHFMWNRLGMAVTPFLMATAVTGCAWGFGAAVDSSFLVGAAAVAGLVSLPFTLSAVWALLGGD